MRWSLGWSLLLACWLALSLAACGGGDQETERRIPVSGTFVYTVGVDLWIQDEAGSRLFIAAPPEQQLIEPAISPDGARVAYVIFQLTRSEEDAIGSDLAVANLNRPEPLALFVHSRHSEFVWRPRWMPDGDSVLVTYAPNLADIQIVEIDAATGERSLVRSDARDADVSQDGERIVFVDAPYSGDPTIVLRNLADASELDLDPDRAWQPRPFRIPRFTSDGMRVVFVAGQYLPQVSARMTGRNGPEDIWQVDLADGSLTQVAALGEDQPDFALSADGRHALVLGAYGAYLVSLSSNPNQPTYAIAPGEFHGNVDWRGTVSDAEWAEIRESIVEPADSS